MRLDVEDLTAGYGALTVLRGLSFSLPAGARLGVFGHNGAGKTTLLKTLMGAHRRMSGAVAWDGEPLVEGDVPAVVAKGIAFVPQGHNVFPNLSVERNLRIAGLQFRSEMIDEIFRLFPVLGQRRDQRAGQMSGGEQQMLALGMAMMTNPKWLLLDEPSTGLAPVIVRNVMERLREVNERFGVGVIVVEQNVPATLKLVERALILKSGEKVFEGTSAELAEHKDLWRWF
jgi:branched-chain amino acid transport system ATP-binding protein